MQRDPEGGLPYLPSIEVVTSLTTMHRVPGVHSNDATYVEDSQGRLWVRKTESEIGYHGLLAESVAWLLGRLMGVPLPDAALADSPNLTERGWLSLVVPNAVHWTASAAEYVANPADIGAMLALDAIIYNEARHARNILLQATAKPLLVKIWAIDHEESLVGYPADLASKGVQLPSIHNHARGLPIDLAWSRALDAAEKLRGVLDDVVVNELADHACGIAKCEENATVLVEALAIRVAQSHTIVADYLRMLGS